MKIFTKKHFINALLDPGKLDSKCDKATAWGVTIAAGLATGGLLHLFCYIKSRCSGKKNLSAHQVNSIPNGYLVIPNSLDIGGKTWVTNLHLQLYFTYVAGKYPNIAIKDQGMAFINDNELETSVLETDFFDSEATAFPFYIHVGGNHWTLLYIDTDKRTVEYYDSKKRYGNYKNIKSQLQNIAKALSENDGQPYQFIHKTNKTLQPDSYQCGVWVAYFLSKRLEDPEFDFDAIDINTFKIANFRNIMMHKMVRTDQKVKKILIKRIEKIGKEAFEKKMAALEFTYCYTDLHIKWLREARAAKKSHEQEE